MRATKLFMRGLVVSFALASLGCSAVIAPGPMPHDPAPIFVADYGYHASLTLPSATGSLTEYAFGNWEWFALSEESWLVAAPLVLFSGQGTLGRRPLPGPATLPAMNAQLGAPRVIELAVERGAAQRLAQRLEHTFDSHGPGLRNDAFDMEFVRVERRYCLFQQCNSTIADWLRELGLRVTGLTISSHFVVEGASSTKEDG